MAPKACLAAAVERYPNLHAERIRLQAAGGVDVARRIEAGEAVDVVVLAEEAIDKLAAGGHLLREGKSPLMSSDIAVAVRSGSAAPELGSEASVKAAVLAAPSLSFSTGPSGRYLESLFARWGILDEIRPRIVVPPPGTPVAELIAAGKAALGFQQLSEMLHAPGIQVLGALPPAIQQQTVFSGAVTRVSACAEAARALINYLASRSIDAIRHEFGMSGVNA